MRQRLAPLSPDTVALADHRRHSFVLMGAGVSFLASVMLWFSGDRDAGLFVGLWVPSILSLGTFYGLRADRR